MEDLGLTSLPAIGAYVKGRGHAYLGPHSARCLVEYADKLKSPVISPYSETFFANQKCVGEILVVGVFREDEDDDYREDFEEVAAGRLSDKDAFFSIVVGQPALAFLDAGRIDRTPGLLLLRRDGSEESASLDALDLDLDTFVDSKSLPLVGELTAQNFARYEKLRRPMFLLFLDLRARGNEENVVGGRSGGLFNDDLAAELASVARDESFRDRVTFAYCDGVMYGDRMKSLGLFGGRESLPALAFNAGPGSAAPYPESLPIRKEYLRDFVAAFLSRKILSEKDSELFALTKKQHLGGNFMKPRRKPKKKAPKERVGVSEQFGASSKGAEARGKVDSVVELTTENFETEAPEHKDVMIAFHDESCRKCANLAVYYKKVAERFDEEGIDSLVVGRFDTTKTASIPGLESLDVAFDRLPTILFLPAFAKRAPPYVFYSGVSKVQPIMRWAQQVAAISFDLPDLCHLSPEDRILYKEQVTEIENARRKREEEL